MLQSMGYRDFMGLMQGYIGRIWGHLRLRVIVTNSDSNWGKMGVL